MAAWSYEIYIFQCSKRNFLSPHCHVLSFSFFFNTDLHGLLKHLIFRYCGYLARKASVPTRNCLILALLVVFNFGLLIVDHILTYKSILQELHWLPVNESIIF